GLAEAYERALAHDPAFQAARAEREAGQENAVIARAALLPQLSLSWQRAPRNLQNVRYAADSGGSEVDRRYASYAASLTLTQTLFDAAAWTRWRQGRAQALLADERWREQAADLLLRLARAYTGALFAREQVALAQAQRTAYVQQLELNRQAWRHGEGTRTDLAETEASLAQAEVQLIEAQDAADIAQRALQAVTGAQPGELAVLDGLRADFAAALAPGLQVAEGYAHWEALARASNAELAALRQSLEVARLEVQRQQAGHLPTLKAYAQHARNASDVASTYNQRYRTSSVGLMLNVPLYAGGGVAAATRQAARELDGAQYALEARRDEILLDLRRQYRQAESGPQRIAAGLRAVRAAEVALQGSERGVTAGERINLDVLEATRRLYAARRDLAQACYDMLDARLALRWRAGVLSAADLNETAAYFQPVGGLAAP
ncbi:MAG: TolC family outer membrane protein, partial [Comamonas sp.]